MAGEKGGVLSLLAKRGPRQALPGGSHAVNEVMNFSSSRRTEWYTVDARCPHCGGDGRPSLLVRRRSAIRALLQRVRLQNCRAQQRRP